MCGVVGAIGYLNQNIANSVEVMNEIQQHRGPDGQGFWISNDIAWNHGAIFAHRRLAIIDLTTDANQPMIDSLTGNAIVFNGEIYNYLEIKVELELLGCHFNTKSDTEVILLAYREWGVSFVEKLRGMFAIVIWDAKERKSFLYRDRLGVKPLYYTVLNNGTNKTFLFSSEIKTLIKSNLIERKLNPIGVESFIWNGFVAGGEETIVRNVYMLKAGSQMIVDDTGNIIEKSSYWALPTENKKPGISIDSLKTTIEESVELHLISDAPLGVFLSGGIDSSAIASLAVKHGHGNISTYNLAFDEAEYSEAQYARAVAKALGTDHHEIILTQQDFINSLDDAMDSMDQPSFDGINTYFVSREVRKAGITVALAGTGGDELFGGYRSFVDTPKAAFYATKLALLPTKLLDGMSGLTNSALAFYYGDVPPQTRWGKAADILQSEGDMFNVFQISYSLFTKDYYNRLLKYKDRNTDHGVDCRLATSIRDSIRDLPELCKISALELNFFIQERLMRDTDSASMAASLEVRVPFLDHKIIERISNLDINERFYPLGRKQLLKDIAMPGLDSKLFERPKAGFVLPFDSWCRDALQPEVEVILLDKGLCESVGINPDTVAALYKAFQNKCEGIYWSRIWSLYCLLWWSKKYNMTID